MLHRVPRHIRVSPETRQRLQLLRTQRHLNVGSLLRALIDEALKNSRPQMAQRPRRARLEDAHNPISPMDSTGSAAPRLTASDSGLILG